MKRLVARTRRVDEDVDLIAVASAGAGATLWDGGSMGLAGTGEALRIRGDDPELAQARLAGISCDDDVGLPGCGPVAFGAFPFDPDAARELLVPAVIWGRSGSTRWVTTVAPSAGPAPKPPAVPPSYVGTPAAQPVLRQPLPGPLRSGCRR